MEMRKGLISWMPVIMLATVAFYMLSLVFPSDDIACSHGRKPNNPNFDLQQFLGYMVWFESGLYWAAEKGRFAWAFKMLQGIGAAFCIIELSVLFKGTIWASNPRSWQAGEFAGMAMAVLHPWINLKKKTKWH